MRVHWHMRPSPVSACTRATHNIKTFKQLAAKTDQGMVEGAFKLARGHLAIATRLTPAQFLTRVRAAGRPPACCCSACSASNA